MPAVGGVLPFPADAGCGVLELPEDQPPHLLRHAGRQVRHRGLIRLHAHGEERGAFAGGGGLGRRQGGAADAVLVDDLLAAGVRAVALEAHADQATAHALVAFFGVAAHDQRQARGVGVEALHARHVTQVEVATPADAEAARHGLATVGVLGHRPGAADVVEGEDALDLDDFLARQAVLVGLEPRPDVLVTHLAPGADLGREAHAGPHVLADVTRAATGEQRGLSEAEGLVEVDGVRGEGRADALPLELGLDVDRVVADFDAFGRDPEVPHHVELVGAHLEAEGVEAACVDVVRDREALQVDVDPEE